MFSSLDEVYDVSISLNYFLLSVTYNFGWENEPKLKETTVNSFGTSSQLECIHVRSVSQ